MAGIYGWINNQWQPQYSGTAQNPNPHRPDGVQSFLPGSSYLTFKNNLPTPTYANLFTVTSKDNANAALLCLDQGLIVKKDIQAGGALFCSQGALLVGHGLTTGDDPPKITLTHSDMIFGHGDALPSTNLIPGLFFYLAQASGGYSAGYYYYGSDNQWHPGQGSAFPAGIEGCLFVNTGTIPALL